MVDSKGADRHDVKNPLFSHSALLNLSSKFSSFKRFSQTSQNENLFCVVYDVITCMKLHRKSKEHKLSRISSSVHNSRVCVVLFDPYSPVGCGHGNHGHVGPVYLIRGPCAHALNPTPHWRRKAPRTSFPPPPPSPSVNKNRPDWVPTVHHGAQCT